MTIQLIIALEGRPIFNEDEQNGQSKAAWPKIAFGRPIQPAPCARRAKSSPGDQARTDGLAPMGG